MTGAPAPAIRGVLSGPPLGQSAGGPGGCQSWAVPGPESVLASDSVLCASWPEALGRWGRGLAAVPGGKHPFNPGAV